MPEVLTHLLLRPEDGNLQCAIEDCVKPRHCRGWCRMHYTRWQRTGDPTKLRSNSVPPGYNQTISCTIEGCTRPVRGKGYCVTHLQRIYKHGNPNTVLCQPKGSWKRHPSGYVMGTRNGKTVYQHIWIVEQLLGKPLPPKAVVHHVNGVRHDNRPENLVVCPNQEYHFLLHKLQDEAQYWGTECPKS